jgi:hypothetical protein
MLICLLNLRIYQAMLTSETAFAFLVQVKSQWLEELPPLPLILRQLEGERRPFGNPPLFSVSVW